MKRIFTIVVLSLACVAFNASAQGIDTPASTLVGQSSGLRISGSDGSLTGAFSAAIRSLHSLRGDSSPLIVIDGVMLDNAIPHGSNAFWQEEYASAVYTSPVNLLGFLSTDDIESIQVLKDVSATAIYGSRGADGVILIKTKRTRETEPKLSWQSRAGMNSMKGFMHSNHLMVNGSMGRNTFTATAFLRGEDDGFSLRDNLSGGSRMALEVATNEHVKFGVSASFGVQQVNSPSTTAFFGATSMTLDESLDKDISGWLNDYDDYFEDYHAIADAYLDVNFSRFASWKTKLGVNYQSYKRFNFYGETTQFGKEHQSAAAILSNSMMNYHASTELDFNVFAGLDHNIKSTLGAEVSGNRNIYNTMNGSALFSSIHRAKSLNFACTKAVIRTFKPSYFHLSAFGTLGYTYKQVAGIDGSVRVDNTMRYDDASLAVYPAANAYFDIARLLPQISSVCSMLKLTGGWGVAGREAVIPYGLFPQYLTSGDYDHIDYGAQPVMEALSRLRATEYNVGVETSFFNGRVGLDAKYYNRLTSDLFSIYSFGVQNAETLKWRFSDRVPAGDYEDVVSNRGVEVDVNARLVNTKDFDWNIALTAAFQSNQVASLSWGSILGGPVGIDGMNATVNAVGYSISSLYGYDIDASGNMVDHTGDGKIAPEDRVILGNSQPTVLGTFSTDFRFRNFSFSALFDAAGGHKLLNMSRMVKDGAQYVSAAYVEKADFLRLGKVSLTYSIPIRRVSWINSVDLSLSGNNLLCLTDYSGANPDVDSFLSSNLTRGVDMGAMPMYKAVVFGVGLKF